MNVNLVFKLGNYIDEVRYGRYVYFFKNIELNVKRALVS